MRSPTQPASPAPISMPVNVAETKLAFCANVEKPSFSIAAITPPVR